MDENENIKSELNISTINSNPNTLHLRDDLKLGVATAATQIEGGDKNNTWYKFSFIDKKTNDGTNTLRANNHYLNYKNDLKLMKDMNITYYRFSIEWARIEPVEGEYSLDAIEHYRNELETMKELGIRPLLTLNHFSNPLWFDRKGGFLKRKNLQYFYRFVNKIVNEYKNLVTDFCTINEPNVFASTAYFFGDWPPQKKSFFKFIRVMKNFGIAHINAFKIIKKIIPNSLVGFSIFLAKFEPYSNSIFNKFCCKFMEKCFQKSLFKFMATGKATFPLIGSRPKGDYIDYVGCNYYRKLLVKGFSVQDDPKLEKNDLGWSIYPEGLSQLLLEVRSNFPKKEIWITENGIADKDDTKRISYIAKHLRVINDCSFVSRYYHWTFFDNFEWKEGESAKFGLIEYDFDNQTYKIRKSGEWYKQLIASRNLEFK